VPTETLPSLGLSDYLADLQGLVALLEKRGLKTRNTRIERYIKYLEQSLIDGRTDAAKIFKDAQDARFKSPMDWALYVMRETHELAWIAKGLEAHVPEGVDEKLRIIVAGRDFAALDLDSSSRDAQFELRIASYFCQAGCEVSLSATDVVVLADRRAFYIECKRIGSASQLPKRLREARKQLKSRMPGKIGKRRVYGCIAADVTKVAFAHTGITMGMSDDHSRDLIQKELSAIVQGTERLPLFKECSGLLNYWFQIHIPALILQPQTVQRGFRRFTSPGPRWSRSNSGPFTCSTTCLKPLLECRTRDFVLLNNCAVERASSFRLGLHTRSPRGSKTFWRESQLPTTKASSLAN
jgi:hypothetical protein